MKEETKIALIQKDIENIKDSQKRMENNISQLQGIFWTTKGHEEFVVEVNKRFNRLEKEVDAQTSNRQYIKPALFAVLSSAITFLLIEYLQHLK